MPLARPWAHDGGMNAGAVLRQYIFGTKSMVQFQQHEADVQRIDTAAKRDE